MEFHLARDGKQAGSMPEAEIRRGIAGRLLRETDVCWTTGWEAWKPLSEVFAEDFCALPPVLKPSQETEVSRAPAKKQALTIQLPRRRDRTSSAIFVIAGVLVLGTILVGIIWAVMRETPGSDAVRRKLTGPKTSAEFIGTHLEQVAQACLAYAELHGGRLPSYSAELQPLFGGRFEIVMDVPETQEIETNGYVLRTGVRTSMPPDTPIAFEARARADGRRGVAYLSGRVRVYERDHPELKRALQP